MLAEQLRRQHSEESRYLAFKEEIQAGLTLFRDNLSECDTEEEVPALPAQGKGGQVAERVIMDQAETDRLELVLLQELTAAPEGELAVRGLTEGAAGAAV